MPTRIFLLFFLYLAQQITEEYSLRTLYQTLYFTLWLVLVHILINSQVLSLHKNFNKFELLEYPRLQKIK